MGPDSLAPSSEVVPSDLNDQWMYWMRRGEFERAWQISDLFPERAFRAPDFAGRRVLVRCEHGLGDTIQFIRYLRLLRPLATQILVHAQPCMVELVHSLGLSDQVFTWNEPWPSGLYDLEIEIMDLPHAFRTTLASVPAIVPYLTVDHGRVSGFQHPGSRNVGLVWASSSWDPRRGMPLQCLAPLAQIPGIALFSLQHGPEWKQALDFPALHPPLEPANDDILDTAAAIQRLDLVITVDTMVAHLAGALAKPVWLMLPFEPDWRWMLDRGDSPWYPGMRIFRQSAPGEWDPVIQAVVSELGKTT